jgi:hypothetical protein
VSHYQHQHLFQLLIQQVFYLQNQHLFYLLIQQAIHL